MSPYQNGDFMATSKVYTCIQSAQGGITCKYIEGPGSAHSRSPLPSSGYLSQDRGMDTMLKVATTQSPFSLARRAARVPRLRVTSAGSLCLSRASARYAICIPAVRPAGISIGPCRRNRYNRPYRGTISMACPTRVRPARATLVRFPLQNEPPRPAHGPPLKAWPRVGPLPFPPDTEFSPQ